MEEDKVTKKKKKLIHSNLWSFQVQMFLRSYHACLTFVREDSVEDVGQVRLLLSDPSAQVLPVQQVEEETKLTHQLLHSCRENTNTHTHTTVNVNRNQDVDSLARLASHCKNLPLHNNYYTTQLVTWVMHTLLR